MRTIAFAMLSLTVVLGCSDDDDDETPTPPATSERVVTRGDIVADQPGAVVTDPQLINAWGLAFNPAGAAWVAAAESGISAVYDANGNMLLPAVTIPAPAGVSSSAPTGVVFNEDPEAFMGDEFIFVTEDGTISGWQPSNGTEAVLRADNSGDDAIYKGVAIALDDSGQARLFAADFHNGRVDVFDMEYEPMAVGGGFADENLPDDFAPFNVEELEGFVVVAYAKQDEDREDDVKGAGNGYVNLFDTDGELVARLVSQGELDSPWGVTMSPSTFGAAPNRLLIGNFGDGRIHVYTLDLSTPGTASATLDGALRDTAGNTLVIDGLWALEFGVAAGGFSQDQLYFTAGPDDETHGVFGRLQTSTLSGGGGAGGTGGTGGTGGGGTGGTAGVAGSAGSGGSVVGTN